MKVDPRWNVRGWAIKKKLDEEKADRAEGKRTGPTLGDIWLGKAGTAFHAADEHLVPRAFRGTS